MEASLSPPSPDAAPARAAASEEDGGAEFPDAGADPVADRHSRCPSPPLHGEDVDGASEAEPEEADEASSTGKDEGLGGAASLGRMTSAHAPSAHALGRLPPDGMAAPQQLALKAANETNCSIPPLHTSLLGDTSGDELGCHAAKIAEANGIPPNDESVLKVPPARARPTANDSEALVLSQSSMPVEDDMEERDAKNRSEADGVRRQAHHASEGWVDEVEVRQISEKIIEGEDLLVPVNGEDLSSPANTISYDGFEAHMEDPVVATESAHEAAADNLSGLNGGMVDAQIVTHGHCGQREAPQAEFLDDANSRNFQFIQAPDEKDVGGSERQSGGANFQEEPLNPTMHSGLPNKKSGNFQVVEGGHGEDIVGDSKGGRGDNAEISEKGQCDDSGTGKVCLKAESVGQDMCAEKPANDDAVFGDALQDSQQSDAGSDKDDAQGLKLEHGTGSEESHVQKSVMQEHDPNFTVLDGASDKECVHSGQQVEADDDKANGELAPDVKEEQAQNGSPVLLTSAGGKLIVQRVSESVESGLGYQVSNGYRRDHASNVQQAEVASEEEDDDDNSDDDEENKFVDSSLGAFIQASELVAQIVDNPSASGGGGPSLPGLPAGLGKSLPSLEPAPRSVQHVHSNGNPSSRPSVSVEDNRLNGDIGNGKGENGEKLQTIRVKFLRLAQRLGQSAQNVVVAQVLYRLELAEQLRAGQSSRTGNYSFERANAIAEEQEVGKEELDFTCTIMLLGKTGVGKSATINSIFDEVKSGTDAFSPATNKVREITCAIHGIKLRVIDTPGLLPSFIDQRHNGRIMSSVKRFIKKSPPDIVLYFDRLDMHSRDYGDLPLLRTITNTFGAAIWFNAIVVLTHASSAPPDGANGAPLSYEMFVAQRSHFIQQTIRQAAGDMRLMNPVSLVENHPACRTNRSGQRVLPNGQVWKPQLLLLCFASKVLAEANSLLRLQDSSSARPFGVRSRVPPFPFLLSSLLQSRAQLKLPEEQMGDEDESDEDLREESESDDEVEYDELPPFRRLTKSEVALLDKEQKRAYFEELEYREELFKKKQWKEELKRRADVKKRMAAASKEGSQPSDEFSEEEENSRAAAVPVPMPDMVLPPSFDSDNPSHRYRYLETANQWLVRPVLEPHGWDHDNGYDSFNMEKVFVIAKTIPASVSGQITKDKKEASLQMEGAVAFKHGEGRSTLCGLDIQTIGKDLAYTLRSETKFSNFRRNKTTGGIAVTFVGDTVSAGMKLEDKLTVARRLKLVLNAGAVAGRKDMAYGGSFEATLREKEYPIGRALTTLGLSVMNWRGDLAIGGNLQSQVTIRKTLIAGRANLNNRGAGQVSVRVNSSEQLQLALIGIIPLMQALIANRMSRASQ